MAVTSGFFDAIEHDRLYNAEEVGAILEGVITDGILNAYGMHFEVTKGNALDVIVGSGRGRFKNTWIKNDDNLTLTAEANVDGVPRIDTVVIDVNKTDEVRANSILIVKGTNVRPTLIDEAAHKQYPLADITIDATGSSITTVLDRRDEIYSQNPSVLKPYWPIGSIFISVSADFNPTNAFGGVWERISGRFLIGCGGTSGLKVNDIGGSWEHSISVNNLPSHNHNSGTISASGATAEVRTVRSTDGQVVNSVMGWANSDMSHAGGNATNYLPADWNFPYGYQGKMVADGDSPPIAPSKSVTDEVYITSETHYHAISGYTGNTGQGAAMTIKPPYLAVHMWKRVS